MKNIEIKVKDYAIYPGLRYANLSDHSGEDYYHKVLNNKFKEAYDKGVHLIVDLDGVMGYPPSFLDESFGNLVYDFGRDIVEKHLKIISLEEPELKKFINDQTFKNWDERKRKQEEPKKTVQHEHWHCIVNGVLSKKEYGYELGA
ncbi:STAS-like domain-containing protein [Ornithobacterium rhinotracheale]|uniref:STAS-like domain-containing protein n=1 Tax=Ornithobacterium rhinotracheale TaxID=28251 RepID=UPI00403A713A